MHDDESVISLKEIPYDPDDEEADNYCPVGADRNFEILIGNNTMGICYISADRYTASGLLCPTYLDWIEFASAYRGKGLLRPVLNALHEKFGTVYLEATKDTTEKYRKCCQSVGVDSVTGLEIFMM